MQFSSVGIHYLKKYYLYFISAGQWVSIALERDFSTDSMNLFINDDAESISGIAKNIPIGLPGTIRLGHLTSPGYSMTGRIACFIIQSKKYEKSKFLTDIQDCKSSNWLNTQGNNTSREQLHTHYAMYSPIIPKAH